MGSKEVFLTQKGACFVFQIYNTGNTSKSSVTMVDDLIFIKYQQTKNL